MWVTPPGDRPGTFNHLLLVGRDFVAIWVQPCCNQEYRLSALNLMHAQGLTPSAPPRRRPPGIYRDRVRFRVRSTGRARENNDLRLMAIGLSPSFSVRIVDGWRGRRNGEPTSPWHIPQWFHRPRGFGLQVDDMYQLVSISIEPPTHPITPTPVRKIVILPTVGLSLVVRLYGKRTLICGISDTIHRLETWASLRVSRCRLRTTTSIRGLLVVASKSGLKSTRGAELSIVRDVLRMSITEPRIWDL